MTLEECASVFDTLADLCDKWAAESQRGGWSTHQVIQNKKTADECRRYAAQIRATLRGERS